MTDFRTIRPYEGRLSGELDTAALSIRWKTYWSGKIRPYLGQSVLEVGAGIGANTPYLLGTEQKQWVCLEPDPLLAERIPALRPQVEVRSGILQELSPTPAFDTIIYIDVLEHIEHDAEELTQALQRLRPGGNLIVLSPAYQSLYTGFDKSIGHFRRYNRKSLLECAPAGAKLKKLFYLDSVGLLASLANKVFLRQSAHPTTYQALFWDRLLVPTSRLVDRLIGYSAGKSIVAIWTKL